MTIKKRFIAGAKCPKCSATDSIIMLTSSDDEWIECVDCEYTEKRPTEVEHTEEEEVLDEIGVVQFKPMPKS